MSTNETEQEGVIKYSLDFLEQNLAEPGLDVLVKELNDARSKLMEKGLIGQDPVRYNGDGFGNISLRLSGLSFLVSGSQTGHLRFLDANHLASVDRFDLASNQLHAHGKVKPSSESMTHGVAYQSSARIQAVVHVHSPDIWPLIDTLGLPFTASNIPYGTPQMAEAVRELLCRELQDKNILIFAMKGHQDGVVAVGESLQSCTSELLRLFNVVNKKRLPE